MTLTERLSFSVTCEGRELDSLSVGTKDLCWLDHQVCLNRLRLRRVETGAKVHRELVQSQSKAGHIQWKRSRSSEYTPAGHSNMCCTCELLFLHIWMPFCEYAPKGTDCMMFVYKRNEVYFLIFTTSVVDKKIVKIRKGNILITEYVDAVQLVFMSFPSFTLYRHNKWTWDIYRIYICKYTEKLTSSLSDLEYDIFSVPSVQWQLSPEI